MIIEIRQDSGTIDCVETNPQKRAELAASWRAFMRAYLALQFDLDPSEVSVECGEGMGGHAWVAHSGPDSQAVIEHVDKHGFDAWLKSL